MLLCASVCLFTGHAADKVNAKYGSEIEKYFTAVLNGSDTLSFKLSRNMGTRDIDATRRTVWQLWTEAVAAAPGQKLPALRPLSADATGRWVIPSSLEPDAVMDFYYGVKGDTMPAGGYPLFIYMHGSGPRDVEWRTGLALAEAFDDAPSAYFVPRIPNEGPYFRWWQQGKQWVWERLLRQALVSDSINPDRIYMFGISEGGYGSQRLASYYADYLAAAGPMAGGEPLKNAPVENCRNTPFSLLTGAEDRGFYRNKLTGITAAAFDSLALAHPGQWVHRIELIPGRGHGIDYRPTTPWMAQFSRSTDYRHVTWEDFEMDGRHRHGFANLWVMDNPSPADSIRTLYELDIEANVIRLNTQLVEYVTTETDSVWGIALQFDKKYSRATEGRVKVYLDENVVDFRKPVTLIVNGHEQYYGKLRLNVDNMVNSCAEFGDPERIFPAMLDIYL